MLNGIDDFASSWYARLDFERSSAGLASSLLPAPPLRVCSRPHIVSIITPADADDLLWQRKIWRSFFMPRTTAL